MTTLLLKIAKIIANDRLIQYGTKWEILSDNIKKHYLEQALEVINMVKQNGKRTRRKN